MAAVILVVAGLYPVAKRVTGASSGNAQPDFAELVITRARILLPDRAIKLVPEDREVVMVDGVQVGLVNMHRKYEQSDKSSDVLDQLILDHLSVAPAGTSTRDTAQRYDDIESSILPQLMPVEYVDQLPLCHRPFASTVLLGYVIDEPTCYQYITEDGPSGWGKQEGDVFTVAISNLNARSGDIQLHVSTNRNARYIAIITGDGFDAARIVVPQLRTLIGDQLGYPFRFGVPNRDFLICWPRTNDESFQAFIAEKLAKDFAEQPYPLSPSVFEVDKEGLITELPGSAKKDI